MSNSLFALGSLVDSIQAGFWGSDVSSTGALQVRVVRNGDAARAERIDAQTLPKRWVNRIDFERARTRPGDIVLVSSGDVGKVARIVEDHEYETIVSNFVRRVRPAAGVDAGWLFRIFQSAAVAAGVRASSGGTALQNLSWSSLSRTLVHVPPSSEQRRIAEVIDALDDNISSIERVVAKLSCLKQGLLEDLVGAKAPNATLRDALLNAPANGIYKPAHLIGRGTLLVGQTAFTVDRRVDPAAARRAVVTPDDKRRFGLQEGDILVSRVFATLDGVGQPALVSGLMETAVFESNMMRIRCDRSKTSSFFVFQTLLTQSARAHIVRQANLSNQASISQAVLTGLAMWLPGVEEQLDVAEKLKAVESAIHAETSSCTKLRSVKAGLLADLLTGRVRVPLEVA